MGTRIARIDRKCDCGCQDGEAKLMINIENNNEVSETNNKKSPVGRFLILGVRGYQKFISPMFPPTCRYYPTCSSYFIQAVMKYGALKGSFLGVRRILRCHPFRPGGYDPLR